MSIWASASWKKQQYNSNNLQLLIAEWTEKNKHTYWIYCYDWLQSVKMVLCPYLEVDEGHAVAIEMERERERERERLEREREREKEREREREREQARRPFAVWNPLSVIYWKDCSLEYDPLYNITYQPMWLTHHGHEDIYRDNWQSEPTITCTPPPNRLKQCQRFLGGSQFRKEAGSHNCTLYVNTCLRGIHCNWSGCAPFLK